MYAFPKSVQFPDKYCSPILLLGYKKKAGGSSSQAAAPSESDDKRQSATHEDVDGLPPINGSPPPIPPQMMEAKEGVGPSCNHKTSSPTKG